MGKPTGSNEFVPPVSDIETKKPTSYKIETGSNSVVSFNQQGGITAQTVNIGARQPTTEERIRKWAVAVFRLPLDRYIVSGNLNFIGFLSPSHYAQIEQIAQDDDRVKVRDTKMRWGFAADYLDSFKDESEVVPENATSVDYALVANLIYASVSIDPSVFGKPKAK